MNNELLEKLYYNPRTGFIGATPLYHKAKEIDKNIKLKTVQEWLKKQATGQIHLEKTKK